MRVAFVRHDPVRSVLASVLRSGAVLPVRPMRRPADEASAIPARVDVVDQGDRFGVKVDLPGVSRDDIKVAVEGANVSVTAAKAAGDAATEPQQTTVLRAERPAAKYARTLHLPAEIDGGAAEATFENGVLTLNLPKRVRVAQIVVR
ncbi:MAG TPA: Hsp20/alpha crystallin family protein [Burkholderiaceae bacterium]|nr:Hsp20/alpha crystallin family protein [Burkholderiaceae bacterium]